MMIFDFVKKRNANWGMKARVCDLSTPDSEAEGSRPAWATYKILDSRIKKEESQNYQILTSQQKEKR